MPEIINSIVVCVHYDDFLSLTLPSNQKHFNHTTVVTSSADTRTQNLVSGIKNCSCLITNAFYLDGAHFNKGRAIETAITFLQSEVDWICIWDADIVMPNSIDIPNKNPNCLYTPIRRILDNPHLINDYKSDWSQLPSPTQPNEFDGYFQLFSTKLLFPKPWYGIDWKHAGGGDSDFEHKFLPENKVRPPFEVLHLGTEGPDNRIGKNWVGRTTPRLDGIPLDNQANQLRQYYKQMVEDRKKFGTTKERITKCL